MSALIVVVVAAAMVALFHYDLCFDVRKRTSVLWFKKCYTKMLLARLCEEDPSLSLTRLVCDWLLLE